MVSNAKLNNTINDASSIKEILEKYRFDKNYTNKELLGKIE